ncbi:MAG TPA: HNH endonuclease [Candidatus Paceibacterota bacterium]|nr:HNH endonuclease [Candidatus Paceibacterota bacterium]
MEKKTEKCLDCGIMISRRSKRCKSCAAKLQKRIRKKTKTSEGYILCPQPNHPNAMKRGSVSEHRLIVEKKIGRYLKPEEVIHHINGKKDDNRIENLMLFQNDKEHQKFHNKIKQFGFTTPRLKQIEERWK